MKKLLFLFLAMLSVVQLSRGQTVSASGGSSATSSSLSLSWTVGEPVTTLGATPSLMLTSGYQQSYLVVTPMARMSAESDVQLSVFPNPTQDVIQLGGDPAGRYTATILSLSGVLIESFSVSGQSEIDVRNLTAGTYMLTLTSEDGQINKSFRITKVQ